MREQCASPGFGGFHGRICRSAGRFDSQRNLPCVHDESLREFFDEGPNLGPAVIVGVADDAVLTNQRGFKSGLVGASVNLVKVVVIATELNHVGDAHHTAPHRKVNVPQWTHRTFSSEWPIGRNFRQPHF
jgi:hypothetical protein